MRSSWVSRFVLVVLVLGGARTAIAEPAPVACKTVADCWLDDDDNAIKRPKKYAGKPIPRGECTSKKLRWLRTRLTCEENLCVAKHIGDKC